MVSVNVLVVGLSHRSAPVELLEQLAVGAQVVPKLLDELVRGSHVIEVVMLSTCNHRVVHKLLHTPTVQVKRLAGGPDGTSYARTLSELFELDPQIPAAVAVARRGEVLPALDAPAMPDRAELGRQEFEALKTSA